MTSRRGEYICQTFRRGGRCHGEPNCRRAGGFVSSKTARGCLIAMWVVRDIQNYASCLNFTGWDLLWQGRDARIFPSRRTSSNVRHDDKSSARTTSGTASRCGHPSETQSFPISRATGLKNVARKRAAEKRPGKATTAGGEEGMRLCELLPRRCHVSLIGHIAAKNVSRPRRGRDESPFPDAAAPTHVARDVINISIFQHAADGFH
jgi:hypothetical protein